MSAGDRQLEAAGRGTKLDVPREEAIREAQGLLMSLEERYERAFKCAASEKDVERIDAAFDEVDRLQREMISAIRRVRELEREADEPRAEAGSNVRTLPPRQECSAGHAHRP